MLLGQDEASTAGFYIDSANRVVVLVQDSTRFESARSAMQHHLMAREIGLPPRVGTAGLITRKAQYGFQQLSDWRDDIADHVLGRLAGVYWLDLDERLNRVSLGVTANPAIRSALMGELANIGVPAAAVHFEASEGIKDLSMSYRNHAHGHSLAETMDFSLATDTLGGGYLLSTPKPGIPNTYIQCTASIVADRSGTRGVVTVSHCSYTKFGVDTAHFLQPVGGNLVGSESVDPSTTSCGGHSGGCRNSDADFIPNTGSLHARRGGIAKLQSRASGSAGTTSLNTSDPWINVVSASTPYVGETLDKVGSVTGWTYGSVSNTCTDILADPNAMLWCQTKVGAYVGGGDSGGPVFWWDGENGAYYLGDVVAAGDCTAPCNALWFSPISGIQSDLGSVNVTTEITVGTPSVSGSINGGGNPVLSWSAVSTTNTSAATSYRIYRSVWNSSTYTWTQQNALVGSTTSTAFTDASPPYAVSSYVGGTQPNSCVYTFISYYVEAYNSGVAQYSSTGFFQGAADGATPWQFTCP